jgi:chloramphenicol-sensitive protein RarD
MMSDPSTDRPKAPQALAGVSFAGSAFLIWGLSPIYWKALAAVPAFEILMHRMIWSFVFLAPLVLVQGRWGEFRQALTRPFTFLILLATTVLVAGNWFLFIWAINSGHILQTSLGYYINPLVNVVLGVVFLRERLRRRQLVAVGLASAGVLYFTLNLGQLPWVSLALAFSFGLYGLIRKVAPVSPMIGLTVETLLLTAPAAVYLVVLDRSGAGAFLRSDAATSLLLVGAALVTGLPLLLFTNGAKRLHMTTIGFLQYIAPSCTFLLAVLVYHETLRPAQFVTFVFIWSALALYSWDSVVHYRKNHQPQIGADDH